MLYALFSCACAAALLLLLAEVFNYPLGLKVSWEGEAGSMGWQQQGAAAAHRRKAVVPHAGAPQAVCPPSLPPSLPPAPKVTVVLSLLVMALCFALVTALTAALKVGNDG